MVTNYFMTKQILIYICSVLIFILQSCSVIDTNSDQHLDPTQTWALLPFQNHTATPRAGEKIESILTTLLHAHSISHFVTYPSLNDNSDLPELDDRRLQERALAWARENHIYYAITGSVEEWRYKTGVSGEPVVGISIRIVDIGTGRTVWSATGARSGWSTESLTGTAQKLIRELLSSLEISNV